MLNGQYVFLTSKVRAEDRFTNSSNYASLTFNNVSDTTSIDEIFQGLLSLRIYDPPENEVNSSFGIFANRIRSRLNLSPDSKVN